MSNKSKIQFANIKIVTFIFNFDSAPLVHILLSDANNKKKNYDYGSSLLTIIP